MTDQADFVAQIAAALQKQATPASTTPVPAATSPVPAQTFQPPQATGFGQPAQQTQITGVSIPINLKTGKGFLRMYIHVGPQAMASYDALMATIQNLETQGLPLDFYTPKKKGSW